MRVRCGRQPGAAARRGSARERRLGRSPRAHGAVPGAFGVSPGTRRDLARSRDADRRNRCGARRRSRTHPGGIEAGVAAGGAPYNRPGYVAGDERAPVSCRSGAPGRHATRPGSRSPRRGVPRAVRAQALACPGGVRVRGDEASRGAHAELTHGCDDAALRQDRAGPGARLAPAHPGALGMSRALRRRDARSDEHAQRCWHISPVRAASAESGHAVRRRRFPAGRVVPGAGIHRRHGRARARAGRHRITRLGSPRPPRPDRGPRHIQRPTSEQHSHVGGPPRSSARAGRPRGAACRACR